MYKFKSGSRFLVTGGAGFIGSNLVEKILDLGFYVRCLDDLSTGDIKNIEPFLSNPLFEFIEGDIRDYNTCLKATLEIDFVLHQAAWGSVPRSIEMPLLYEEINIRGTLNMLEASRENKVKKFVYASSSSVYGDEETLPKVEEKVGELLSPYAITKKANEYYGKVYKTVYNLDTYGLRYFNVFGRRQTPDGPYAAVIPKFIKQLLNDEPVTIHGDGMQSRDFTYIDNVIDANLKACLSSSKYGGNVYNIAYGGRVYLLDLYNEIKQLLNKDIKPKFIEPRVGDIKHSNANIGKAIKELGYSPKIDFNDGIRLAIDWYKKNL